MGYSTNVPLIHCQPSDQRSVRFPQVVGQAMEFVQSEIVESILEGKGQLVLRRRERPPSAMNI